VGTVTKGTLLGMATSAKGDARFVGSDWKLVSISINDFDGAINHQGPAVAKAYRYFGHLGRSSSRNKRGD
jgi:hypothetical protein